MRRKQVEKYHVTIRVIHWLMAITIFGLIAAGWYMEGLDKSVSYRGDLYFLHKSFGASILILIVLRIILRIATKIPPLPLSLPKAVRVIASGNHYLLYLFMISVPFTGYAMSNMFGHGVNMFGLHLPKIFSPDKETGGIVHDLHGIFAYTMLGFLVWHAAAALGHRFLGKDKRHDILRRIV